MTRSLWLLALLFPTLQACKVACHAPGHHASVHDTIAQKQRSIPPTSRFFPHSPTKVDLKKVVPVRWENPSKDFFVQKRTPHLKRYPCSGCHDNKMQYNSPERFRATHGDILLKHAAPGTLQCRSCHQRENMDRLQLPAGGSVSFDRAYQLCASCHQSQARDWAGGAHGKRISFWYGTRTVHNCTSCHNPHQPLFPKKWPKIRYRPFHPHKARSNR